MGGPDHGFANVWGYPADMQVGWVWGKAGC